MKHAYIINAWMVCIFLGRNVRNVCDGLQTIIIRKQLNSELNFLQTETLTCPWHDASAGCSEESFVVSATFEQASNSRQNSPNVTGLASQTLSVSKH